MIGMLRQYTFGWICLEGCGLLCFNTSAEDYSQTPNTSELLPNRGLLYLGTILSSFATTLGSSDFDHQ